MVSLNIPGIGPAIEQRVAAIDSETLEPVIRAVLDDETATVDEWNRTQMPGGVGGGYFGTALFRVEGTATTRIKEHREYHDRQEILDQLGVTEE
jgi:hypothetical protein